MRNLVSLMIAFMIASVASHALAANIYIHKIQYPMKTRTWIVVEGSINPGDSIAFSAMLDSNRSVSTVVLNSNGGYVDEGLAMASIIRDRELNTYVGRNNICDSICAVMFMGGKKKYLFSSSQIGVHTAFDGRTGTPLPEANAEIGYFFGTVGVSQELLYLWVSTPSTQIVNINDEDYIDMFDLDFVELDTYAVSLNEKLFGVF